MVRNYTFNNMDLAQPIKYPISKNRVAKRPPLEPVPLPASSLFFGDMAEQLTARICTLLIGAHGPHFIGRIYPCKG